MKNTQRPSSKGQLTEPLDIETLTHEQLSHVITTKEDFIIVMNALCFKDTYINFLWDGRPLKVLTQPEKFTVAATLFAGMMTALEHPDWIDRSKIKEKKKDQWDEIHYDNLSPNENELIRFARRRGFAEFFPMSTNWEAQGINTLKAAIKFLDNLKLKN